MEPSLSASIVVPNKNNTWITDSMVSNCKKCDTEFSIFVRRHHCRCCGNIFCYSCSNNYISVPDFITDKPDRCDFWNPSYYFSSLRTPEERVCSECFDMINERIRIHKQSTTLLSNPPSLEDLINSTEISTILKNHYLNYLRNIQYYLPNHQYSDMDKKILCINSQYFPGHSKYLVNLIKSLGWSNNKKDSNLELGEQVLELIRQKKYFDCKKLYCTRTCQETLSFDDCTNILYTKAHVLPDNMIDYIFSLITKCPEKIIECHIPFFGNLIQSSSNQVIRKHIFSLIVNSKKLTYAIYWYLNHRKNQMDINTSRRINDFVCLIEPDVVRKMQLEYTFYSGLMENLENASDYLMKFFDQYKPISLPYDPDVLLLGVDYDSIIYKNSHSKPVIIKFMTTSGTKKFLFKREPIINDMVILDLITLCNIILKETFNQDFNVVTYPVSLLTQESGMIEIIDNATTIYEILNSGRSIMQYILEKNEDKKVKDIFSKYIHSLVSYTLYSYFLGLGDRHLQNIMITNAGEIFHIDFGFILGNDPYPITSTDIKLNANMLDVIGGQGSEKYENYLNICMDGVVVLRKYFNMFFVLLAQIKHTNINEQHIEKFILSRFQPRQTDEDVKKEVYNIIVKSNNNYSHMIKDFIHYHTQEKTVQTGLSSLFKNAYDSVINFKSS